MACCKRKVLVLETGRGARQNMQALHRSCDGPREGAGLFVVLPRDSSSP